MKCIAKIMEMDISPWIIPFCKVNINWQEVEENKNTFT
jgi:hypothetical protein